MLTVGQTHNVKFKVNVMGTSAEPRVRVILGTSPELSFTANKDLDDWVSNMSIPAHIAPGDYDLRVEVHLNNRLFTPINKKINVKGIDLPEPVQAAKDPLQPGETPVLVKPSMFTSAETQKKPAPPMPKVQAKLPTVQAKVPSLMQSANEARPAELSALSAIANAPVKKRFEALSSGMPKSAKSSKPITVKISEIDAVTTNTVSHVIEACKPVKSVKSKAKRIASTPVKLVKEQMFYE